MADIVSLDRVISVLLGAGLALAAQFAFRRATLAAAAKRLALAFSEELRAARFYDSAQQRLFGGFSSQVFDSLFRELSESMPESLTRDLLRYHWRMKYLAEAVAKHGPADQQGFIKEAEELRGRLLPRLDAYSCRDIFDILHDPQETCDPRLLQAGSATQQKR